MSKRQRKRVEKQRRHQGEQRLGRSIATGAGVTVGATLLMGGAAQAATLTVGSSDDTTGATDCALATNTDCTLRDAIEDANADADSTIVFASAISGDAITLGGTELPQITASTTIQGPGADQIAIDGDFTSRIFNVSATNVTISGLTIRNGTESTGGGIYLQAGNLTIEDSVVTGNAADFYGGGIYVFTGNLTVDSSTISYNDAHDRGGGIAENSIPALHAGTATIRNSTLSGNETLSYGGAVYFNYQSPASVENSTIYENFAGSVGGGLYHFGQPDGDPGLTVTGSTITHNDTLDRGGGIGSFGTPGFTQPTIRNTIVSANTSPDGPDLSANAGSMDVGFSLIGDVDPDTTLNPTGPNLNGVDPQLGALANNGGPTETQKPAATSPAIDAGSAFGLTSDQRGLGRPFNAPTIANVAGGDGSDIGAVELQASDVPQAPAAPTTPVKKKKKCKKKSRHKAAATKTAAGSTAESAKKKKCKKKKKK